MMLPGGSKVSLRAEDGYSSVAVDTTDMSFIDIVAFVHNGIKSRMITKVMLSSLSSCPDP